MAGASLDDGRRAEGRNLRQETARGGAMTSDDEDEDRATYGDERARGRRDDVGVERRMKGGYEYGGGGTRMGRAVVLGEGMGNAGRGRQRRQRRQ